MEYIEFSLFFKEWTDIFLFSPFVKKNSQSFSSFDPECCVSLRFNSGDSSPCGCPQQPLSSHPADSNPRNHGGLSYHHKPPLCLGGEWPPLSPCSCCQFQVRHISVYGAHCSQHLGITLFLIKVCSCRLFFFSRRKGILCSSCCSVSFSSFLLTQCLNHPSLHSQCLSQDEY